MTYTPAFTTASVNLREGPSTSYRIVECLQKETTLFIDKDEQEGDWYLVLDIDNDIEGYVNANYIYFYKEIDATARPDIQEVGESDSYQAEVSIENQSKVTMTLRLNDTYYTFEPHEKRNFTFEPGSYFYRASSPGIIPCQGNFDVKSFHNYEWWFYIKTIRTRR